MGWELIIDLFDKSTMLISNMQEENGMAFRLFEIFMQIENK